MRTSRDDIPPYVTKDRSLIRELMHPAMHGNRNLSLAEATIAPDSATDLHRHHGIEEIYHVMEGKGIMTLGNERFSIAARDTICIMSGQPHKVENPGTAALRILCCCAPAYSHEQTEILG